MAHGSSKADDARFQTESDVRTLVEANRIRGDKTRMAAVMRSAREQKAALEKMKGE